MVKTFGLFTLLACFVACSHKPQAHEEDSKNQSQIFEYGFSIKVKNQNNKDVEKVVHITQCGSINHCRTDVLDHQYEIPYEHFVARLKVALRKEKGKNILLKQKEYLEKRLADLRLEKMVMGKQAEAYEEKGSKATFGSQEQALVRAQASVENFISEREAQIKKYETDLKFISRMKTYKLDVDQSVSHLLEWIEQGRLSRKVENSEEDQIWKFLQKVGYQVSGTREG